MPFSESSSNLPNHQHDQTIVQNGGALDMNNVTSGSMAAGSITFDDGTHLQELPIGAATEVLTVAGGVPTWAAASGGSSCSDNLTLGTQTRTLCEWLEIGV
jgi:hypothetical protein|tara:strand:+ start:3654 stop:3956 length:303 start_codon:yes stop_codon:yes gene_type:complete